MRIGIDISQTAFEGTGVANYMYNVVQQLLMQDTKNEYVLFYSSLRRPFQKSKFKSGNYKAKFKIKQFPFPPSALDFLWNRLHILPVEQLIGDVDIFITSDWTEPPTKKAKKMTVLYDLIVYKYPKETDEKIIAVQKRKLNWVQKESEKIMCISEATKQDAQEILGIDEKRLVVVYPGI